MASVELNNCNLILDANLKAYYRFESGALTTDSSGEGHTLTAISDPAEDASGKFGGAVALDGNDAYSATDHADFKPTGNFTVGAWVKMTGQSIAQFLFQSFSINTNRAGWRLYVAATTGYAAFDSAKNTGTTLNTDYKNVIGSTDITDGNWHFLVGTWDGSYLRLFVDGVQEGGDVSWANAPAYAATNYIRVGCFVNATNNANYLTGSLDDVFLINGTALSADQIKGIYDGSIKVHTLTKTESLAISEVKSKKATKVFSENVSISSPIFKKPIKVISENVSYSETLFKKTIKLFVENLAITEIKSVSRLLTKVLSENIEYLEAKIKKATKVLSENLSITEIRKNTIVKLFSESHVVSEVLDATAARYKAVIDSIAVSEAMTKRAIKNLTENLAITENLSRVATLIRSLTENLAITEVVAKFRLYRVNLTENLAISEVLAKVGTFVRTFTENISIDENIASIKTYVRSLTENLAITESLSKLKTNFRAFTENLAITEVFAKTLRKFAHNIIGKISSMEITGKTKQMYINGKIKSQDIIGKIKRL